MASASEGRAAERHRGRERALQMLYQWEVGRADPDEVDRTFWQLPLDEASEPVRRFASELWRGTVARLDALDPLLSAHAANWRLERMAVIDRLILRLALYELTSHPETPAAVIIDEAVELAKTYSSDTAAGFVNGLLDAVARGIGRGGELS